MFCLAAIPCYGIMREEGKEFFVTNCHKIQGAVGGSQCKIVAPRKDVVANYLYFPIFVKTV